MGFEDPTSYAAQKAVPRHTHSARSSLRARASAHCPCLAAETAVPIVLAREVTLECESTTSRIRRNGKRQSIIDCCVPGTLFEVKLEDAMTEGEKQAERLATLGQQRAEPVPRGLALAGSCLSAPSSLAVGPPVPSVLERECCRAPRCTR